MSRVHEEPFELWEARWPKVSIAEPDELKHRYRDRWVRFHCLPGSKRYPEDELEYSIVLDRYNTVLQELFNGKDVWVVTARYTSEVPYRDRRGVWKSVVIDDDPDFGRFYAHLFVVRSVWRRGLIDRLLRRVVNDEERGVVVTDPELRWTFHPYDGGMDVLAPTTAERDRLREKHRDWLSRHPGGF